MSRKKKGCLPVVIGVLLLCGVAGFGSNQKEDRSTDEVTPEPTAIVSPSPVVFGTEAPYPVETEGISEPEAPIPLEITETPEPESPSPLDQLRKELADLESQLESDEEPQELTYVLNTNTKKFHYPSCSSVKDIKSTNRQDYTGTRDSVLRMGYSPCGRCHP